MLKHKLVIPILAVALVGGGLIGTGLVMAQDNTDPTQSLVQRIAQKFNLNQAEVQAVFDQDRQDKMAKMQANLEQRLTQAVTDGKITEVQKTAILAKLSEMKNNHPDFEGLKDMTQEERKTEMEKKRTEMESWASQNGLSLETFHELIRGHKIMFKGPKNGVGTMKFEMAAP